MNTDTNKARLLGKAHPACQCCTDERKRTAVRRIKRRERQAVARMIRLTY